MTDDPGDYVERAVERATADAADCLTRHGGHLVGTERWVDDVGHWLRIRGVLDARPEVEVQYARVLLPSAGPDKDAETEAILFSSGFEERLHTRAPTLEAVEGVVRL